MTRFKTDSFFEKDPSRFDALLEEIVQENEDGEEMIDSLAAIGLPVRRKKVPLPRRVKTFLLKVLRSPVTFWRFVYGKVHWRFFGRRALLKRLDEQSTRWKLLAGIKAQPAASPRDHEVDRIDRLRHELDHGTAWQLHHEAVKKVTPAGNPPVVTDTVAVDYHVVVGRPYLVHEGKPVESPAIPKPKRKRTAAPKKRTRGKPHR